MFESNANPTEVLHSVLQDLRRCHFTFESDREVAIDTLVDFEWTINTAVDAATEITRFGRDLSFDRGVLKELSSRGPRWCLPADRCLVLGRALSRRRAVQRQDAALASQPAVTSTSLYEVEVHCL